MEVWLLFVKVGLVEQASQDQKELRAVSAVEGSQVRQESKVIQVTKEHLALQVQSAHQVFVDQMAVLAFKVLLDYREILAAVALQEA